MELKNLFTKLKHKEENHQEYFFAVEITEEIIKTAIWTVADGQTQVVKIGQSQAWDGQTQEKLVSAIDQSISAISANIFPEPSGVIFGLPEPWLDSDNIVPDKKNYLKAICQELELKPLGFVISNTAVIQYLKIDEGTPPSAIFLQLNSTEINLSLVKLGKLIGTQLVGRSEDLGQDVEEGLSRFDKVDTLPSRMILYDGQTDFEEEKQQLTSYDWEEKLPFIHFPKVEVLPVDASIKAISLAGGSEVAKSLGFDIKPPSPPPAESTAADLGFSAQDIALTETSEPEPPPKLNPPTGGPNLIQLIKGKLLSLHFKFPSTPKAIVWIAAGFIGLLILVFCAYWYLPKAQITLYFESKTIETNLTLTIDPKASTLDPVKAILPGESVDISVEGSQSIPTTGTALIGDPAQGDITIYNYTDSSKTFSQGTILIGPDNLTFILDDEVTATSSGETYIDEEGKKITPPGKINAKITAKSIGPDSNLPSDAKLSFKQYSEDSYLVKTSGLSGGTSQEIKAVSQADQDKLLTATTTELISKAQTELQSRLGGDKALVTVEDQEKFISKKFNHSVDEKADTLVLEAKLEYTALSYNQKDLQLLLNEAVKEKIPENFQVSDSSEVEMEPAQLNKDKTATIQVGFKAKLLPKLDIAAIKKQLKGHYPAAIQDYLTSLPSFLSADIIIKPNLPAGLKTLPHVTKNILLEIKSK